MGVVGIDMSGPSPANFSLNDWEQAAQIAHTGGIGVTIHTGEVTDIQEMWDVVEKIKPHRIGHGIKAIQDKKLMKVLSDKKIVLELCPTSNVRTSVVKNWEEMGTIIKTLQQNNVLFTINSDGPVFLDTNVKKEFQVLLENKILTKEEVKTIISLARNTSFIK